MPGSGQGGLCDAGLHVAGLCPNRQGDIPPAGDPRCQSADGSGTYAGGARPHGRVPQQEGLSVPHQAAGCVSRSAAAERGAAGAGRSSGHRCLSLHLILQEQTGVTANSQQGCHDRTKTVRQIPCVLPSETIYFLYACKEESSCCC